MPWSWVLLRMAKISGVVNVIIPMLFSICVLTTPLRIQNLLQLGLSISLFIRLFGKKLISQILYANLFLFLLKVFFECFQLKHYIYSWFQNTYIKVWLQLIPKSNVIKISKDILRWTLHIFWLAWLIWNSSTLKILTWRQDIKHFLNHKSKFIQILLKKFDFLSYFPFKKVLSLK